MTLFYLTDFSHQEIVSVIDSGVILPKAYFLLKYFERIVKFFRRNILVRLNQPGSNV